MGRNREELFEQAVSLAQQVLSGVLDPNNGCAQIGKINALLGWPTELSGLGAIAHEQSGHENFGITAEDCIPDILKECKNLVQAFSSKTSKGQS